MLRGLLEINIWVISILRCINLKLAETQGRSCLQHPSASKKKQGRHNQSKGKKDER